MAGVVIDSSPFNRLERKRTSPRQSIQSIQQCCPSAQLVTSSVAYNELLHGIYRATTADRASRRKSYLDEVFQQVEVLPFTRSTAAIAARIAGEQARIGDTLPAMDVMIAATALELHYDLLTLNVGDFSRVPGLRVVLFTVA